MTASASQYRLARWAGGGSGTLGAAVGPVVVSVVLVAACIVVGGWLAFGGDHAQAATATVRRVRDERGGTLEMGARTPGWWIRLRSGFALGCLSAALGLAAAAAFGIVVLLLYLLLRSSVG